MMTEEKRQALREAMEAQQRANEELRKTAKAREKAGLPEWD